MTEYDWALLNEVNKFRNMKNLKALQYLPVLSHIAAPHSEDMARDMQGSNHHKFDGRAAHFPKKYLAENTAFNFQKPFGVVHKWSESEGHFLNMIGDFDYFGCATHRDIRDRIYITVLFLKK